MARELESDEAIGSDHPRTKMGYRTYFIKLKLHEKLEYYVWRVVCSCNFNLY